MKTKVLAVLILTLVGCGTSVGLPFGQKTTLNAAQVARIRAALEADGKPSMSLRLPKDKMDTYMVPYYPTKGAMVWSTTAYETVTLRDGVVTATRGLGRDIMASLAPDASQIGAAVGSFHRIYEYLDGNDAVMQVDFDCDFQFGGSEDVVVLGLIYPTRLVIEDCSKGAIRFQNRYWFDAGGKIRQSEQLLSPDVPPMLLQRIVD